jgi:hypothetical protein
LREWLVEVAMVVCGGYLVHLDSWVLEHLAALYSKKIMTANICLSWFIINITYRPAH